MEKKICAKCKREKYLSDFNKSKGKKDGYKCYCRECTSKENRIYILNNKDKVRNYYIENKEKYKDKKRLYDQKNKNKLNENKQRYVKNNPEKRKEQSRRYYENHKDEIRERNRIKKDVVNTKRRIYNVTHPHARIAHNLRTRIGAFLSHKQKGGRLHLLLGCDVHFFVKYLESLFENGMSWLNYGRGIGKWSVDHIIPLDFFNLENDEDIKKAFHWTNCRPMWYSENASKGALHNGIRKHKK